MVDLERAEEILKDSQFFNGDSEWDHGLRGPSIAEDNEGIEVARFTDGELWDNAYDVYKDGIVLLRVSCEGCGIAIPHIFTVTEEDIGRARLILENNGFSLLSHFQSVCHDDTGNMVFSFSTWHGGDDHVTVNIGGAVAIDFVEDEDDPESVAFYYGITGQHTIPAGHPYRRGNCSS